MNEKECFDCELRKSAKDENPYNCLMASYTYPFMHCSNYTKKITAKQNICCMEDMTNE